MARKSLLKRAVSSFTALAIATVAMPVIPAFAETGAITYSFDGYDVEYSVKNEWTDGQSIEIKITNTGDEPILNWAFKYNAEGVIDGLWNASVYDTKETSYVIKNVGWNYEIAPDASVSFGYTLSDYSGTNPNNFELCAKRVDKIEGYDVQYNITNEWDTGLQGEIVITNTSEGPIEFWQLSFDSDVTIDNIWNASVDKQEESHYTISGGNIPINTGESKTIGFIGTKTSELNSISGVSLSTVVVEGLGENGSIFNNEKKDENNTENNNSEENENVVSEGCYPYTMFAASSDEGAITINADNFCVNGDIATNGTIVSSGNMNINGTRKENDEESMIFIFDKINNQYFSSSNIEKHEEDYTIDKMNIHIDVPTEIQGEMTLSGSTNINSALKALEDVKIYGDVNSKNDSVIFSEYGNIIIDGLNANLNGLVYAPFGSVIISAQNLCLNNVVVIADRIILTSESVNANFNNEIASLVGISSEKTPIIKIDKNNLIYNSKMDYYRVTSSFNKLEGYLGKAESFKSFKVEVYDVMENLIYTSDIERVFRWKDENIAFMVGLNKVVLTATHKNGIEYTYSIELMIDSSKFIYNLQVDLEDNDNDGLWNYIEIFLGTDPDKADTDGDGLDDMTEVYILGYNPIVYDTNDNGVNDGDEDEDEDGLTNAFEINKFGSSPIAVDTDHDGLNDIDEYKYGTSPSKRDTDEDGISDYDEIYIFELNPLVADPSDIQLTKTFTVDDMEIEYDEAVYPTITLRGDAECIKNFTMSKMRRTTVINPSAVGYLGAAYDFRTSGKFDGATLSFTYDPELINTIDQREENFEPAIYYFNEKTGDIEEVPNQVWEGNRVTAELEHFSVYLLMNKKALEFFWNTALDLPEKPPVQGERQIAFVLDYSGSMSWNDRENIRGQLTKDFCALLEPKDAVSIYGFNSYITNYNDKKFIRDKADINIAVDKFIKAGNSGGTKIANALNYTYTDLINEKNNYEMTNENKNSVLSQYVFLLTDGESSDTPSKELLEKYNDAGIKIYTVGFGDADLVYLKKISDTTGGKSYSADSSSNLSDIFLKFNDEIDMIDENNDGIYDYYEYLMCEGMITTRTGTKVFNGYTYEEVMANPDLDGDRLKNGEEVSVFEIDCKPYASMSSDPTLIYTDRDSYDDYEEAQNGTSSYTVDYLVSQEDYSYLLSSSNFSFTTNANKYLNEWEGKIAFDYFIDVVFCGSESIFDTIKQGVQSGYYAVSGQAGKVGSENMLMKQGKALLAEYLGKIVELPDDQTNAELTLNAFMDFVDNSLDFYDSVEGLMQLVKKDTKYAISDDVLKYLKDQKLSKLIAEKRREISKLQSDLDLEKRAAHLNRTLTAEKAREFAERQSRISSMQSDIDRNVFSNNNSPAIENRYKNISNKIQFGLKFAQIAYSRFSQLTELIKYSQQLALFEQYREFITDLSHCPDNYVAVSAEQILKDLDSQEKSAYADRGAYEFFMGMLSDAFDLGLDEVIERCGGEVTAVIAILQFVIGSIVGENLSYDRQNLISANLSAQVASIASDRIKTICDQAKTLSDNKFYYIASGTSKCIIANQYMIYFIVTRQFGEEKYAELGNERSGILGWFGFNTILDKYGLQSITDAVYHSELLGDMLVKYNKVFK